MFWISYISCGCTPLVLSITGTWTNIKGRVKWHMIQYVTRVYTVSNFRKITKVQEFRKTLWNWVSQYWCIAAWPKIHLWISMEDFTKQYGRNQYVLNQYLQGWADIFSKTIQFDAFFANCKCFAFYTFHVVVHHKLFSHNRYFNKQ